MPWWFLLLSTFPAFVVSRSCLLKEHGTCRSMKVQVVLRSESSNKVNVSAIVFHHNKYVYCADPIVSIKIYIDDRYSAQIYIIDCIVRVVFLKTKEDPKWRESCDIIPCRQLNQLNSIEKQTVSCWDSKFPFNRGKSFLLSKAKGGIDRTDSPLIIWHHLEDRNQFGTGPEMCLSHSPRNMPKPAAATFEKST